MNEVAFRFWLTNIRQTQTGRALDARTVNSRVANCKTVERHEGDLDPEFDRDKLRGLLERLRYSASDQRSNKLAAHRIPINGDVRTGTATLRSAVGLYKHFREHWIEGTPVDGSRNAIRTGQTTVRRNRNAVRQSWPSWEQPNDQEVLALAHLTTRFVRFLAPEIVRAVVEDNERQRMKWIAALHARHVDEAAYLWEKSACAFPGVRRYAGSREIAGYRGHTQLDSAQLGALALDDNDYPKQIWSFVFRGKRFSKFGPEGYSLAHLADHKDHNNRFAEDFEVAEVESRSPFLFGLYTCPTNTVYIPSSLIKPTDFAGTIRSLLMRRAEALYGGFCNLLPDFLGIPKSVSPNWAVDQFSWADPVGSMNHVEAFLEFRNDRMTKLIEKIRGTEETPPSQPVP